MMFTVEQLQRLIDYFTAHMTVVEKFGFIMGLFSAIFGKLS